MRTAGFTRFLVAFLALVVPACGDAPNRAEFVDHMIATMAQPPQGAERDRWEETWRCTFDSISAADAEALMGLDQGEVPERDLSARVSRSIVECSDLDPERSPSPELPPVVEGSTVVPPTATAP